MLPRPPVVTILGHVDHGKTTLLDYIRKSSIASKEHGGITQKIGGYEITTDIKGYKTNKITFIDTPGHEAFSLLRARGANVADIALLIIDAKDSLMPQTIESISHIKNAKIPFIVVLNKIDLPEADPEKVKNDLLKYEIMVEGKGGTTLALPVSAKTGKGIHELLEAILLLSSDMNLVYDDTALPQAYIIETKKDKRGIATSIIMRQGRLKLGDVVFAEDKKAKIKAIINDQNQSLEKVFPSTPVEILGFTEIPEVGSIITTSAKQEKTPEPSQESDIFSSFSVDSILNSDQKKKKLAVIIKADSQGSLEAIDFSLIKNKDIEIILKSIGEINKSDVFLAKTSKAIVIGFNVKINPEVKQLAKQEKAIIKTYNIIYELIDELNEVSGLMKEKEEKEKNLKGEAKVLASFIIDQEKVTGAKLIKGKMNLGDEVYIFRANKPIGKTKLVSLQIRAKKVQEVKKDQECGMVLSPPLDIRVGDVIKSIL